MYANFVTCIFVFFPILNDTSSSSCFTCVFGVSWMPDHAKNTENESDLRWDILIWQVNVLSIPIDSHIKYFINSMSYILCII